MKEIIFMMGLLFSTIGTVAQNDTLFQYYNQLFRVENSPTLTGPVAEFGEDSLVVFSESYYTDGSRIHAYIFSKEYATSTDDWGRLMLVDYDAEPLFAAQRGRLHSINDKFYLLTGVGLDNIDMYIKLYKFSSTDLELESISLIDTPMVDEILTDSFHEETNDRILIVGYEKDSTPTASTGDRRGFLMKVDLEGNVMWKKTYEGVDGLQLTQISRDFWGNYYLSGFEINDDSETDMFIMKVNSQGNEQWRRSIGDGGRESAAKVGRIMFPDTLLIYGNYENEALYRNELYKAKLNAETGEIYDEEYYYFDETIREIYVQSKLLPIENGGYFSLGGFYDNLGRVKAALFFYDTNYNVTNIRSFGDLDGGQYYFKEILPLTEGGFVVTGYDFNNSNGWLLKLDAKGNTCSNEGCDSLALSPSPPVNLIDIPFKRLSLSVFPNPASNFLSYNWSGNIHETIESWQIVDATGRIVQQGSGTPPQEIPLNSTTSGIYFLELKSSSSRQYRARFVVQR